MSPLLLFGLLASRLLALSPDLSSTPLSATAFPSPNPSGSLSSALLSPSPTALLTPAPKALSSSASLSPSPEKSPSPVDLSSSASSSLSGTSESNLPPTETPSPTPALGKPLGHGGFCYEFSLANWQLFDGSPLAYTPLEIGWDFGNGCRVMTGYDIFYYVGTDPALVNGAYQYSYYQMYDWRTTLLYRFNNPYRLRPIVGVTVDIVGGQATLTPDIVDGVDINAGSGSSPAWGYIGLGALGGLEYLISSDWTAQVSERYDQSFGNVSSPTITQVGVLVVF